ncbi:hypothetical protein MNBD_BACTEROID03-478 [hydrothermal vent metagenome]|uniref:YhcG N-terminal domain-containing protein n=1 Tax=hydrothermal vent metagenome TaxID=652676 RepID=A0A3B0SZV8_9ZZZZ
MILPNLVLVSKQKVAVSLNSEITLLYWSIGNFINKELRSEDVSSYGKQILSTVSRELTTMFGKGYSYSALDHISKTAAVIEEQFVKHRFTNWSWSHFIELSSIEDIFTV